MNASDFLATWLRSESAYAGGFIVTRLYIDINDGDLTDGVLFGRIMYWHGFNTETGKCRLSIQRDGYLWLAKSYADWWSEVRIKAATARVAIQRIKERNLIITDNFKFGGVKTLHLRVNPLEFEKRVSMCENLTHASDKFSHMQVIKSNTSLYTKNTTNDSPQEESNTLLRDDHLQADAKRSWGVQETAKVKKDAPAIKPAKGEPCDPPVAPTGYKVWSGASVYHYSVSEDAENKLLCGNVNKESVNFTRLMTECQACKDAIENKPLIDAIFEICGIDSASLVTNARKAFFSAFNSGIRPLKTTPAEIRDFKVWWHGESWRTSTPTIHIIVNNFAAFRGANKTTKDQHGSSRFGEEVGE